MGSPPENDRYGTSWSMSWSMTPSTSSRPSSSLNALPGPLSSMQCRQARLHSLVICHATYSGAARSSASADAGVDAVVAAPIVASVTRSILDEPALPQVGDEGQGLALDRPVAVIELFLESRRDRALVPRTE